MSTCLQRNFINGGPGHMEDHHRSYHHHQDHHHHHHLNNDWSNSIDRTELSKTPWDKNFLHETTADSPDSFADNFYSYSPQRISPDESLEDPFGQMSINGNSIMLLNNKKGANMTETVTVPSSEHVAEIVGRQGCKIKSLRTQTNTYIRTPVRGQDPMFVVTGRKEDVAKAKQQILSAAEHFSSIRAKRNGSVGPQGNGPISSGTCSPTGVTPGSITISVRVPYKVVGLVVGPKGATIKRIQQTTSTYIVTPGRDKDPVFEVTGNEEQVERAREEIEKHIISRTSTTNNSDLQIDDFQINGIDTNYNDQSTSKGPSNNCLNNYNNISNHHETVNGPSTAHQMYRPHIPSSTSSNGHHHMSNAPQPIGTSAGPNSNQSHLAVCATSTTSSMPISEYSMLPNSSNIQYRNNFESDDGLGSSSRSSARSSSISHSISRSSIYEPSISWTDFAVEIQRSNSVSVQTKPDFLPPGDDGPHPRTRRTNSDPVAQNFHDVDLNTFTNGPMNRGTPNGGSPRLHRLQSMPRDPLDELCEKCDRQTSNTTYAPCARRISRCANCGPELCQMERDTRRQCGHSVLVDTPGNLRRN